MRALIRGQGCAAQLCCQGLLCAEIAERVSPRLAARLLVPLLLFAAGSVAWWAHTEAAGAGDLRAYGVSQFGPVLALLLLAVLAPQREGARPDALWGVIVFYAAAKAVYDTLKYLREGGSPAGLKDRVASEELLNVALRQDEYKRRQSSYLR